MDQDKGRVLSDARRSGPLRCWGEYRPRICFRQDAGVTHGEALSHRGSLQYSDKQIFSDQVELFIRVEWASVITEMQVDVPPRTVEVTPQQWIYMLLDIL